MGTRNMVVVIDTNGELKIAQYGQWDGYIEGVGRSLLEILRKKSLMKKFKKNLSKVRFLKYDDPNDAEFLKSYNDASPTWSSDPDNRTEEQRKWFQTYITRDLSEEIIVNIANSNDEEIILINNYKSGIGDTWVEYSYTVDLKNNLFIIQYQLDGAIINEYDLNKLPTPSKFVKEMNKIINS